MNGCGGMQAKFTEYMDGRLTGREMQRISAHLEQCRECAGEWIALREVQASLAGLGPVTEPEDLVLRIRVAVSQERARSRKSLLEPWKLAWKNAVGPFLLQATAGFASAVLLLGTVIVLVTMFTQPESVRANTDEPLGNPTAPRLVRLSSGAGNNDIGALAGPVVVEVYINPAGQMYDYRIVSGPTDEATRSQVENMLLTSVFEPARFFGQPVRGLTVISFSGVSVKG
jgi:anti-sigma factor RsiW